MRPNIYKFIGWHYMVIYLFSLISKPSLRYSELGGCTMHFLLGQLAPCQALPIAGTKGDPEAGGGTGTGFFACVTCLSAAPSLGLSFASAPQNQPLAFIPVGGNRFPQSLCLFLSDPF